MKIPVTLCKIFGGHHYVSMDHVVIERQQDGRVFTYRFNETHLRCPRCDFSTRYKKGFEEIKIPMRYKARWVFQGFMSVFGWKVNSEKEVEMCIEHFLREKGKEARKRLF